MSDSLETRRWAALRAFTAARIALGRSGNSVPTDPLLAFNLSHAQARDAVHLPLDVSATQTALEAAGFRAFEVESAAPDREHYLRRPDLGRRLSDASREAFDARLAAALSSHVASDKADGAEADIAFVLADGLSSLAAMRHGVAFLETVRRQLAGWRIAPVVIARNARVALADEVGQRMKVPFVAILIGERPGLSSPDSLGVYLTHAPRIGCNDAQRNCISNIRPEGLDYASAAHKLVYLLTHARLLGKTGVDLKDNSEALPVLQGDAEPRAAAISAPPGGPNDPSASA